MYNSTNWNLLYTGIIPILTNTNCVSEHDILINTIYNNIITVVDLIQKHL
jgi:hypothetical protein